MQPSHMTNPPALLIRIEGQDLRSLTYAELKALPPSAQVGDAGLLVPGKRGRAVWLEALLPPGAKAAFLNLTSSDPGFAVSIPWSELPRGALVLYEQDGKPLEKGGPFRFLVPGHADECVHVKQLCCVELAGTRGRDTRPLDDAEHQKLHQQKR